MKKYLPSEKLGIRVNGFLITVTKITETDYNEQLEVLPPIYKKNGFMMGEQYSHCPVNCCSDANKASSFKAFMSLEGGHYSVGDCCSKMYDLIQVALLVEIKKGEFNHV